MIGRGHDYDLARAQRGLNGFDIDLMESMALNLMGYYVQLMFCMDVRNKGAA